MRKIVGGLGIIKKEFAAVSFVSVKSAIFSSGQNDVPAACGFHSNSIVSHPLSCGLCAVCLFTCHQLSVLNDL